MKKSSAIGAVSAASGKLGPPRPRRRTTPATAPAFESAKSTRPELASSVALAVLEPAALPGVPPLRRVRFGYFNPEAREVHVVGSFNHWDPQATALNRDALGDWSVDLELPPGEHRYRFYVDGQWRDDPSAAQTAQNPFGGFDAIMVVV